MNTKKNPNIDPEKYRLSFFLIGLVSVIGILLIVFNWQSSVSASESFETQSDFAENELAEITRPEEPPPPEKTPEKQIEPEFIQLLDDDEIFTDTFTIDLGATEHSIIEFTEPPEPIDSSTIIFTSVGKMPDYPGGIEKLLRDIARKTEYPREAAENGIQGTVTIRIVINAKGKITQPTIIRGADPLLNNEALRVIGKLSDFTPGEQNGRKVSVQMSIPIKFELN
jgi:protein TonB